MNHKSGRSVAQIATVVSFTLLGNTDGAKRGLEDLGSRKDSNSSGGSALLWQQTRG